MKKIILIFRESYDARYLISNYIKNNSHHKFLIVLESGYSARQKKLKNFFLKKSLAKKLLACLDIVCLLFFNYFMMRKIISRLGEQKYPENIPLKKIDDVNNLDFLKLFKQFSPDLIFNYGTSIYSEATLKKIKFPLLNIHCGILPFYRNVHSDFWAYMNDDLGGIGVTIFIIENGIDTGKIVIKKKSRVSKNDSLSKIKIINLDNALNLMIELTNNFDEYNFSNAVSQNQELTMSYNSPNFIDLFKFIIRKFFLAININNR